MVVAQQLDTISVLSDRVWIDMKGGLPDKVGRLFQHITSKKLISKQ